MEKQEPAQITITVFSARNLQSKRKGEVCLASVVFGVSKAYYMTETVESNTPEWNQEAKINLPNKQHSGDTVIKFKVRDKEHVMGVATINVSDLGRHRGHKQWLPLTPHKKSHEAHGEVLIECFISEVRSVPSEKPSPLSSQPGSQEDLRTPKSGGSIIKGRFSFHRRTPSWTKSHEGHTYSRTPDLSPSPTSQDRRLTGSDAELHSRSRRRRVSESGLRTQFSPERTTGSKKISADNILSRGSNEISMLSDTTKPEVTGISPREGPLEGNQRVVLRGCNLGGSRAEIVRVVLAGVDCTDSIEYISSTKLAITTPPRIAPSSGPVLVETLTGGEGVSSLTFSFVGEESFEPPEVTGISPREGSIEGGQRVVLRGNYLGECKGDVVKVMIAGVDCTETLEYISPAKLVVTTLPCDAPTSGPVVIETVNGGLCDSGLTFTFVQESSSSTSGKESQPSTKGKPKQQEIDQAEIKALKQQLKDLKDENSELKEENQALKRYIDNLMISIIETRPDLLEVKSEPSPPLSRTSIVQ